MTKSKKVSQVQAKPQASQPAAAPNRVKTLGETLTVVTPSTKKAFHALLQWLSVQPATMTLEEMVAHAQYTKLTCSNAKPGGLRENGQWTWLCCWYYGIYLPAWLFAAKRASANGHNSMCAAGQQEWNVGYAQSKKLREAAEAKAKEARAALDKRSGEDNTFTVKQFREDLAQIERDLEADTTKADEALRDFNLFTIDRFKESVAYAASKWSQSNHDDNRKKAIEAKEADIPAVWEAILALPENQPLFEAKGLKLPKDFS